MFDLSAWASSEKPSHYDYKIVGVSANALQVLRSDRSRPQTFTKATFQRLAEEGRLEITGPTTFKVERDSDYDPNSQFDKLDLG